MASLYHRPIYFDDAWFAEQAFQFLKFGEIRTEVFQGLLYYENKLQTAHKFHVINGSVFIALFGFSPYAVKAVSIFYTLLLLYFFYVYGRQFHVFQYSITLLFFLLFYLTQNFVLEYLYAYRPEPIIAALGFGSFYLIEKSLQNRNLSYAAIAGFLAGLCAFTHLNGVIFMGAGGLVLLFNKEFKLVLIFSFASILGLSLYFFDIGSQEELLYAYKQFRNDPALSEDNFTALHYITKLVDEHKRFFWDYAEATMTICLLVALLTNFRFLHNKHKNLLYYTLSLIVLLAVISRNPSSQYYLLYMPFVAILSVIAFEEVYLQKKAIIRWLVTASLIFYFSMNIYLNIQMAFEKEYLLPTHQKISTIIPHQTKIMAPLYFVFNEIDNYDMQTTEVFYLLNKKKWQNSSNFFDFCKKHKREYIIIEARDKDKLLMPWEELIKGDKNYQYLATIDKYTILKATFPFAPSTNK